MNAKNLAVADGTVVQIEYTLSLADGEVVDSSSEHGPLAFLQGAGEIIPGLEAAMYGMVADAVRRALPARYRRCVLEKDYRGEKPIKRGEAARLLLWWLEGCAPDDSREAVKVAKEKGLLPAQHAGADPEQPITGAEAYYGIHRLCLALGVPPTRR